MNEVLVDLFGCHHLKRQIGEVRALTSCHGSKHFFLAGNMGHSCLGGETMFVVCLLQGVGLALFLRLLYALDEGS